MTFTKEQLIARAETVLSNARTAADFHDSKPYHLMDVQLAEITLASLTAEPVLYAAEETLAYAKMGEPLLKCLSQPTGDAVIPLYTAPPAPVVPETLPCPVMLEPGLRFGKGVRTQTMLDALQRRAEYSAELEAMTPEQLADHDARMKEFAAMLQGADRPQNQPQNIPENIPAGWTGNAGADAALVMLERIDTLDSDDDARIEDIKRIIRKLAGSPAEPARQHYKLPDDFDFDRFNDVVWLEAVASSPHMYSPTTSTIAMVALELNKRLESGNSPAIPDGWVACSERMPEDAQWCAVNTEYGYYVQCWSDGQGWLGDEISIPNCDVTHWIQLPAAPQQEAK